MVQGLCRVGRYDEKCKRLQLIDIPLIDKDAELKYNARLMQFCASQSQEKALIIQMPSLKPRPNANKG
jgi:hypothetical protein